MSVLVFAENWNGAFKKSTYEAIAYSRAIADQLNTNVVAIAVGKIETKGLSQLGNYGADKVLYLAQEDLGGFAAQTLTHLMAEVATKELANTIVFSYTYTGKSLAGRVAAKLKAGLVAGATELPTAIQPLTIRKKCYSGKGIATVTVNSEKAVIGLTPNSYKIDSRTFEAPVENIAAVSASNNDVKLSSTVKTEGKIILTEAELVVSAGRGLKAPENWTMVETLAKELQAATACSKPVADIGWRPHEEHVGQTGITIGPNLYIAIGISGAIQHLAGVSSSKTIVVINSDAEAPFFKAADYGVVGDAFEVVPQLIASLQKFKAAHN